MTSQKCQILLLGDSSVGKTSLITRYANGIFKEEYLATIGLDYYTKEEMINNQNVLIQLWDTAGQERFKSLPRKYYQNADGVFLLFDVTKEDTFNNVSNWINDVKENSNLGGMDGQQQITLFLLGNKIDSPERIINREQGEKFFENNCAVYNMGSNKGYSVKEIVETYEKANGIKLI